MQKNARYIKKSAAFMRVLHNEKHASATCLPERIRRFYISDARSLICKNGNTSVALPPHSPEADRCSRVFLQTMPTGFFHKHSSVSLPSYSPEADRCSRVFLRTLPSGFFHKHSSGRRDAGEYKQLSAAEAYPRVQK